MKAGKLFIGGLVLIGLSLATTGHAKYVVCDTLAEADGVYQRVSYKWDRGSVGLELGWAQDDLAFIGGVGSIDIGDRAEIPNPLPISILPETFWGQGYVGLRAGLETEREQVTAAVIAGYRLGEMPDGELIFEYQYGLTEGDQQEAAGFDMHSTLLVGFRWAIK